MVLNLFSIRRNGLLPYVWSYINFCALDTHYRALCIWKTTPGVQYTGASVTLAGIYIHMYYMSGGCLVYVQSLSGRF